MTDTYRWGANAMWVNLASGAETDPGGESASFFFTVQPGGNDSRNTDPAFNKDGLRQRIATALGRDLGGRIKFFDGGSGIDAAIANKTNATPSSTEPQPVFCFKQYTTARLNARMDVITEPEVWVWDQEFYGGADNAAWNAYNAKYQDISATVSAHANGSLVQPLMVSSNAQERRTPGYFASANALYAGEWGADAYNAREGTPYTAATLWKAQYEAWQQMLTVNPNIKWVVAEYGISRIKYLPGTLYTAEERLGYVQDHIQYLIDHGCSGITYWAVDNSRRESAIKDWSLDKATPQDAEFALGVAALMNQYPLPAGF